MGGGEAYDYIRDVDGNIGVRNVDHNYSEIQDKKVTALSVHRAVNIA